MDQLITKVSVAPDPDVQQPTAALDHLASLAPMILVVTHSTDLGADLVIGDPLTDYPTISSSELLDMLPNEESIVRQTAS